MKSLLSTLLVSLLIAVSSFAADRSANYLGVAAGLYAPQSSDLEDFDAGFSGEFFFGRRLSTQFSAEVGVGYFSSTGPSGAYMGRLSGVPWTGQFKFSSIPITATLLWSTPFSKGEFFVGAGVGAYVTSIEAEMESDGFPTQNVEADDTPIGGHLRLGGRYSLSPRLDLGVRLQYALIGAQFEKEIDDYTYSRDFGLDGITAVAGIDLNF